MNDEFSPLMLRGRFVILAVSGGIASYKSIELARLLALEGAEVQTILTQNALNFVQVLPFQILTNREPITKLFPIEGAHHPGEMPHISLTDQADLIIIAPATANIIGKFANGIGDDFLSTLLLSAKAPVLIVPAMNPRMWTNSAVQSNLKILSSYGHFVLEPELGRMARPEEGVGRGRMQEPSDILIKVHQLLLPSTDLAGMRLLVTAGPTRERWDAVRFISNRSSGKMGYAIASVGASRGAEVTLVSGPVFLPDPPGVKVLRIESAEEMRNAVFNAWKNIDAAVMAAAIADYRPAHPKLEKQKKSEGPIALEMERTTDIIAEMAREKGDRILVGFAAETENLRENAREKLKKKNLDLIVGNLVSGENDAMGSDSSRAFIFDKFGNEEELPLIEKNSSAKFILDHIAKIWQKET